jgi:hypothetical protein
MWPDGDWFQGRKDEALPPEGRASFHHFPWEVMKGASRVLGPRAALPSPLTPDGGLTLPLPLGAGLFIETAFPEFRVEAGPLHFPLEPAEGPIEALIVLDDDFQTDHAPFRRFNKDRA